MHRSFVILGCVLALCLAASPTAAAMQDKAKAKPATTASTPVNLNTTTTTDLQALPDVGAATARLIIEHQKKNGSFKKVEKLMNIKNIGEKSFLKLKPMINVSPQKTKRQDDNKRDR